MSWNLRNRTPRGESPDRWSGVADERDVAGEDDGWYAPQNRVPAWQRGGDGRDDLREDARRDPRGEREIARAQLDDVADALGRLMREPRAEAAGPNRHARRAAASRARTETRMPPRPETGSAMGEEARTSRIEAVLSALDRLDRRVEDLSQTSAAQPVANGARHHAEPAAIPACREARGPVRPSPAPAARAREAWRDPEPREDLDGDMEAFRADLSGAHGHLDRDGEMSGPDMLGRRSRRPADDLREDAYPRRRSAPSAEPGDDLRPLFQDLARRIEGASGPRAAELATLRGEIGELRAMLMESLRAERNRPQPRDTAEMRRLSDAVERLRADRGDMRLLNDLRDEITDLRATIGQSNVDGMLKSLESGYAHLVQRLDELARGRIEPRLVDELADRLAEIEGAFRIVPRADQLSALDDRVADIGHRVEELVRRNGGEEVQALRGEIRAVRDLVERIDVRDLLGGIDESIAAFGQRLDAIDRLRDDQRAMADRLDAIERRVPHGGAIDRLHDRLNEITGMLADDRAARSGAELDERLDERLGEITGRLKRIESARQMPPSYDAAFTLLEKRLAAIDGKISALDRPEQISFGGDGGGASIEADLIARLESGIARLNERFERGAPAAGGEIGDLREEISALRESVSRPLLTDDLEARLRDLAEAASRGAGSADMAVLAQVEDKIAALAAKLDAAEAGFTRLGDLHSAASGGDNGIAGALRDDLHRLMDAATSSERRSRETMDSVQDVLVSINERLRSLELGDAGNAVPEIEDTRPLEPGSGKPQRHRMSRSGTSGPSGEPMGAGQDRSGRMSAPSRETSRESAREPARDAAARAAAAAQASGDQAGSLRDRKADFIAAARRAAQAATEEAETRKGAMSFLAGGGTDTDVNGASAAGWLRSRLPGRRRVTGEAALREAGAAPDVQAERREGSRRNKGETGSAGTASDPAVTVVPPAADEREGSGGRQLFSRSGRRAILLAAAAVVIALGALQMVKLATPGVGEVALGTPPAIENTMPPAQMAATDGAPADSGGQVAASSPVAAPDRETTGREARSADPSVAPDLAAAAAPRAPTVDPAEANVAFAPPVAPSPGFSAAADAIPAPGFQAPSATPASVANAPVSRAKDVDKAPASQVDAAALARIPSDVGSIALRQAAAAGDPAALFTIAVHYTEGTGVTPDLEAAARFYAKAADAGLAPAQYRLGSLYEKGRGVTRNLETARDWYLRAAEQGNAKAAHNLAVLYAEGLSGTPEFRDAAYWFKRAAEYGLADSQYNLGILYARGLGLEKNLVESYKWFALAARQGDTEAGKKRDEVANMLSREDLAEARLAVETWTEQPRAPAANEVDTKPSWSVPANSVSKAAFTADPRELVMNVQRLLAERGFDPGTPDGQIGPRTRDAVRAYQKAAGLSVTGAISNELLASLTDTAI